MTCSKRKVQSGAVLPMFTVGLIAIIGMAGLALDMGHAYVNKANLQNALDAAALSGAAVLNDKNNTAEAQTAAEDTFEDYLDGELKQAFDRGDIALGVEFSATLDPWAPGAIEPDATYVRVAVPDFPMTVWLARVLPGVGDLQSVGGSAVAGPSPPLGAPPGETCDIAPMLICGDPDDTDCSDGSCYGYDLEAEEEITLKTHSANANEGEWEVGPGNFQLIELDCGPGGACVRDELAGGYSGCVNNGETVTTKPGNTVGPTAQGFNTRFGIYQGGMSIADYPPDVVTYSDGGNFWYDDYQGRMGDGNYDYTPVDEGGQGVPKRRILAVPIGRCTGTTNGQGDVEVLGLGCFFMTRPASHSGNTQEVYGQLLEECEADGEIPYDPGPATGPLLFKIILYKDPIAQDA